MDGLMFRARLFCPTTAALKRSWSTWHIRQRRLVSPCVLEMAAMSSAELVVRSVGYLEPLKMASAPSLFM
jgi:hypothetical protein